MANILSIDDDPELQDLIHCALREHGHEVHWAFTGEEGCRKALALKPDIILLDMMLPTINGLEVLRRLKADETLRHIPVIVISAAYGVGPFTEESVKKLGAQCYLQKPVRFDDLASLIDCALTTAPGTPSSPKNP